MMTPLNCRYRFGMLTAVRRALAAAQEVTLTAPGCVDIDERRKAG